MITDEQLENWFSYHAPDVEAGDVNAYHRIRVAGKALAVVIRDETPASADQTDAIRKVREAVMTANAARACGGK